MAFAIVKQLNNGSYSIRIQVYGTDVHTGEKKIFARTYNAPQGTSKRELDRMKNKYSVEFEHDIKLSEKQGKNVNERNPVYSSTNEYISLVNFAKETWLPSVKRSKSVAYYERGMDAIKRFEAFFAFKPIKDIVRSDIVNFISYLSEPTKKTRAILSKSIDLKEIHKSGISLRSFEREENFSRPLYYGLNKGKRIEVETALKICEYFNLKFEEYFATIVEEHYYSYETVHGYKRILSTIMNCAVDRGIITINPAAGRFKIDLRKKHEFILDENSVYCQNEVQQLLDILDSEVEEQLDKFLIYRHKIAIELAVLAGLRIGEVCGLQWKDIDFDSKTLKVRRSRTYSAYLKQTFVKEPKTRNSKRTVTLSDKLIGDLQEFRTLYCEQKSKLCDLWDNDDYILTNDCGNSISVQAPYQWFKATIKKYNLKPLTFHGLRHTHITLLLSKGVPVKTVAARVGHEDASVTLKVYSHFIPETDKLAADCLDKMFV